MPSTVPVRCSRCILPLGLPGVTADETFEQAIAEWHVAGCSSVDTSLYFRVSSAVWRAIGSARGTLAAAYGRFR